MPIKLHDITVVILTGGKSSRMGQNKALLELRGMRLVDYVAGIVQKAGINNIYISGEIEGYQNIPDLFPGNGPIGGIYSSIEYLHNKHNKLLFLPVDMPLLSADFISFMVAGIDKHEAFYFRENPLPCVLRITENVLQQTQQLRGGFEGKETCSVNKYLSSIDAYSIPIPDKYISNLTNTNTPEEWQEAGA